MNRPGLLFAATDGCFRHLGTPMEFEYLLLSTLQSSPNAESWESGLSEALGKTAEDDCSISGIALNAGSFDELKRQLAGQSSPLPSPALPRVDRLGYHGKKAGLACQGNGKALWA